MNFEAHSVKFYVMRKYIDLNRISRYTNRHYPVVSYSVKGVLVRIS